MTNEEVMQVAEVLAPVLQQEIDQLREQVSAALSEHAEAIQGIQVVLNTEATRRLVIKVARNLGVTPTELVRQVKD